MKPTMARPSQAPSVMLYTLCWGGGRAGQARLCPSSSPAVVSHLPQTLCTQKPSGKTSRVSLRVLLHIPTALTLPSLPRGRNHLMHHLPRMQNHPQIAPKLLPELFIRV